MFKSLQVKGLDYNKPIIELIKDNFDFSYDILLYDLLNLKNFQFLSANLDLNLFPFPPRIKNYDKWLPFLSENQVLLLCDALMNSPSNIKMYSNLQFASSLIFLNPHNITLSSEFYLNKMKEFFFYGVSRNQEWLDDADVDNLWKYLSDELDKTETQTWNKFLFQNVLISNPLSKNQFVFWCRQILLCKNPQDYFDVFLVVSNESARYNDLFWKLLRPNHKLLCMLPAPNNSTTELEFEWKIKSGLDPFSYDFDIISNSQNALRLFWNHLWLNCKSSLHIERLVEFYQTFHFEFSKIPFVLPKNCHIPSTLIEYLQTQSNELFEMYLQDDH